jgi:hypothetical protein
MDAGREYRTIQIGDKSYGWPRTLHTDPVDGKYWAYNDNRNASGDIWIPVRLGDVPAVVCPDGWRLPSGE